MKSDNSHHLIELINHYNWICGAELGVRRGDLSISLLVNCPNLNLICVDLWEDHRSINERHNHKNNYDIFLNTIKLYSDRVNIIRNLTNVAHDNILDESLDFVFVDATHTYNAVKEDISLWLPKIKKDGMLCGHDYCEAFDKGGVVKAIREVTTDIIELSKKKISPSCNVSESVSLIKNKKNVADRETGCWFIWKSNIG